MDMPPVEISDHINDVKRRGRCIRAKMRVEKIQEYNGGIKQDVLHITSRQEKGNLIQNEIYDKVINRI